MVNKEKYLKMYDKPVLQATHSPEPNLIYAK